MISSCQEKNKELLELQLLMLLLTAFNTLATQTQAYIGVT